VVNAHQSLFVSMPRGIFTNPSPPIDARPRLCGWFFFARPNATAIAAITIGQDDEHLLRRQTKLGHQPQKTRRRRPCRS